MKKKNIIEEKKDFTKKEAVTTEIIDTLINVKTGEEKVINHGCNIIVTDFGILVAALLKQHSGYSGATYWAVGEGEGSSWDSLTSEQLQAKSHVGLSNLYGELQRVVVDVDFIDDDNLIVSDPTNRIEIRATFDTSLVGQLRELAIFGGDATITSGSGVMIDHKVHPVINFNTGSEQFTLNRILRMTF
jgi:hypothetical protein